MWKGVRRMKQIMIYLSLSCLIGFAACSADDTEKQQAQTGVLNLTSTINDFEGEEGSAVMRTNMEGTAFAVGDRIKLKIICPYSSYTQFGETTYSNTADGLWLLKWTGSNWEQLEASDSVDMIAQYKYTSSYRLFSVYEAQQTPYVYTASTWNENVFFMAPNAAGSAPKPFSQYSYIFRADQTLEKDYLKCDLLWAQTYMQTGAYNVHLAFNHVMACLKIKVTGGDISDKAVVTLEGMPDIDQREVVVGDYYAAKAKNVTHASGSNFDYSYKGKCSCSIDNNGKVLGVAVIDDSERKAIVYPMTGNPNPNNLATVPNTGVYTAHHDGDGDYYYLIVPPCELTDNAEFWIRDGEKRYSYQLNRKNFEQGKLYPIIITLTTTP